MSPARKPKSGLSFAQLTGSLLILPVLRMQGDGAGEGGGKTTASEFSDLNVLEVLLPWILLLDSIEAPFGQGHKRHTGPLSSWVSSLEMFPAVMNLCTAMYGEHAERVGGGRGKGPHFSSVDSRDALAKHLSEADGASHLSWVAAHVLHRTVSLLPAVVRQYWSSAASRNRILNATLLEFVEVEIAELVVRREISIVTGVGPATQGDGSTFSVRGSAVSREVSAHYVKVRVEAARFRIRARQDAVQVERGVSGG